MRRRNSSIVRRRRGSTIQDIALGVPDGIFGASTKTSRKRASSLNIAHPHHRISSTTDYLFPLSDAEKDEVWKRVLEKYDVPISVSFEDQMAVEDTAIEETIEFQEYLKYTLQENLSFEKEAQTIIGRLDQLLAINDQVTDKTQEFQVKSNELVVEISQFDQIHTELCEKLAFFEALDPIVQTLNTRSSATIVMKESFQSEILDKLDESIRFVEDPENTHFKELEVYKLRFSQCMVRALSLMRNYVTEKIREVEQSVQKKVNEAGSSVVVDAVLYDKFGADLAEASQLFVQLYKRGSASQSDEYFGLVDDCYNQYYKSRASLARGQVQKCVDSFADSKTCTEKVQTGLTQLSKLLGREQTVFEGVFFVEENPMADLDNAVNIGAMNNFFESLMEPVYEALRDQIIRETNIGQICEAIGIMEGYYDYEEEVTIDYRRLLKPLLEDAQARLIFKVRQYIDKNVVNYRKTGKEKSIQNRKSGNVEPDAELDMEVESETGAQFAQVTQMIYPPVMKSIRLLNKIYQLVNQTTFDDLANSIVHLAIQSLLQGYQDDVSLDSKLYVIKNLMFLKDYMSAFDVETSTRETSLDFSGITALYKKIVGREPGKSHNRESYGNPLVAAVPRVVTDFFNCKGEIQSTLRDAVHQFIDVSKQVFVQPLEKYPAQADLKTTMRSFMSTLQDELPRVGPRIRDYVEDAQTMYFLIDGIQEQVLEAYKKFYEVASRERSAQVEELLDEDSVISSWGAIITAMMAEMEEEEEPQED